MNGCTAKTNLKAVIGNYRAPQTGLVTIVVKEENLVLKTDKMEVPLYTILKDKFGIQGTKTKILFFRNEKQEITKIQVFEDDNLVEEAIKN